jgi:uncharacterized protein (DUF3084 family)
MTEQTSVTRDEFEQIKTLLASAARYAEAANAGLGRLEAAQQRSQFQIDQLTLRIDQLTLRVDQLLEAQRKTEQRFEAFLFESQRLMTSHAERLNKLEGISERLEGILSYLVRQEGGGE